jgi:hypothetical protein
LVLRVPDPCDTDTPLCNKAVNSSIGTPRAILQCYPIVNVTNNTLKFLVSFPFRVQYVLLGCAFGSKYY